MAVGQTQLFTKRAQVFVTEETADQDTYKTQAAGEAILAEIPDSPITFTGSNYIPTTVRGDYLSSDEVPGLTAAEMTFRVPAHGAGVDTAPEYADALLACGYKESLHATNKELTYYPFSTFDSGSDAGPDPATRNPGTSYSVTLLEDGVAYQIKGAFGNVVFVGNVGEPLFLEFTFTGAFQDIIDDALETVTYDAYAAPIFTGASFSHNWGGAVTPKGVSNFTLDTGNVVTAVSDVNDSNGTYGARITDRKSFGSFNPEMVLAATEDWAADWRAGTTGSLETGEVGSTNGNKWELKVNRCVLRPFSLENREGIRVINLPFGVSSAYTDAEGTNLDIEFIIHSN